MKPLDRLPALPVQAAFMRLQVCISQLQPFMSEAEFKSVRTKICEWDLASDAHSYARLEWARKQRAG